MKVGIEAGRGRARGRGTFCSKGSGLILELGGEVISVRF